MAGRKLFTNKTVYTINVTLVIRRSADPRNTAGKKEFKLSPSQSSWEEYGNRVDIYLNGINLVSFLEGSMHAQQDTVIVRGSAFDNELNMYNAVDFTYSGGNFDISTRQVY